MREMIKKMYQFENYYISRNINHEIKSTKFYGEENIHTYEHSDVKKSMQCKFLK